MSKERSMPQWWLPVAGMIGLAFAIGLGGGSLLGPVIADLFGTPEETAPLDEPDNLERRVDLIAGEAPPPPDTAETATQTATAATGASELLQSPRQTVQSRTVEDSRRLERHLLALDSPLTPPVTDIAARIRQDRKDRLAAQTPAAGARAVTKTGTEMGTETGSMAPGQTTALPTGAMPVGAARPAPAALHVLARGSVIPAVLQSPIDSELPGMVRAQVSEDVYDSLTGTHVLIPRGARLTGTYGQAPGTGQRRLFVAWTDLRLPDGTPIDPGRLSTLGADGASGLEGRRSTGFWQALGAAVLFDLAGNATAILTNQQPQPQSDLGALAGAALGNATSRVTSDYIGTLLNRGPRFRVKAGSLMNVLVEQDLSLPATRAGGVRQR